jgi:hypothetical protein
MPGVSKCLTRAGQSGTFAAILPPRTIERCAGANPDKLIVIIERVPQMREGNCTEAASPSRTEQHTLRAQKGKEI